MRTFVVGDVHGQADMLLRLLEQLRTRAKVGDPLVFLGDYVDRGPDSRQVVDLVLAQEAGQWPGPVTPLKGNHEALMLDSLDRTGCYHPDVWLKNGGAETIVSYEEDRPGLTWPEALPPEHRAFLDRLRSLHEDEHGIYVHAGLPPGMEPEEADDAERLWIRDAFIDSDYRWRKVVVFGHTPQYERDRGAWDLLSVRWRPLNRPEKIGLDTGAAYGGPLTAVILPEREFVSVR